MKPKNALEWEESKYGTYGSTLESIQAEFQSYGLKSKGSSKIYYQGVTIGTKLKYICLKQGCTFAARIIVMAAPNSPIEVETSSK